MIYKMTLTLGFWLFLTTVQSLYAQQTLDGIVAVIDDDIITRSELDVALAKARSQIQQRGTSAPPPLR
jgi:hypothetical protein